VPKRLGRARDGLGRFFGPILRRSVRFKRSQQARRKARDIVDGGEERLLIRLRRFREAANLAYELQGGGLNLVGASRAARN